MAASNSPGRQRAYGTWQGMKYRCYNPKSAEFHNYGGRGISVCQRWLESFEAFLEDMGERPEGMSIDRIDVNGNYEPGNCRWADSRTQRINQRDVVILERDGEAHTVEEWGRILGVHPETFRKRIRRGLSGDAVFTGIGAANMETQIAGLAKPTKRNTSGYRGVCFRNGRWVAQSQFNGKMRHLGHFDSAEDAHRAYVEAQKSRLTARQGEGGARG